MPIMTYEDFITDPISMLVYGPVGVGKTVLVASAVEVPEMRPVLFADFEKGYRSIGNYLRDYPKDFVLLRVRTAKDLNDLMAALSPSTSYATVVVDSLTEFHATLLRYILQQANRSNQPAQLQDYRDAGDRLLSLLRRVKDQANVHFLATCGESMATDQLTGALHIEPDIVGKLAKRVPRFFDIVGYLNSTVRLRRDATEIVRTLQVQPYNHIRAKDRTPGGLLGPFVENPTMSKIYDVVVRGLPPAEPSQATLLEDEEEPVRKEGLSEVEESDDPAFDELIDE